MKIFIFGIGYMTNLILDYITEIPNSIEVLGFIDNNSEKWGGGSVENQYILLEN